MATSKWNPGAFDHNNNRNSGLIMPSNSAQKTQSREKFAIINTNEAELYIHPFSKYDEPFPKFAQPVEVGVMISDSINKFHSYNVKYNSRRFKLFFLNS
jgi:hypothetical protein